jgi:hypothetical protein
MPASRNAPESATLFFAAIDETNGFKDHVAGDLKALRAELVNGVLRGVVEGIVVAVSEVDDVSNRHANLGEGDVIIASHAGYFLKEV